MFLYRFCVGDRFYLCDNKILCETDYDERLQMGAPDSSNNNNNNNNGLNNNLPKCNLNKSISNYNLKSINEYASFAIRRQAESQLIVR